MAAFVYDHVTERLAKATLNLSTADIRVRALMSNTTAGAQRTAVTVANITTLDEFNGAGYTAIDLAGITVVLVGGSNRSEVRATTPQSFGSAVAAGTRSIVALLYYVRIDGTNANDLVLQFDDTPPQFPIQGDGGPLTIALPASGFTHIAA